MRRFPLDITMAQRRRYPDWPDAIPYKLVEQHKEFIHLHYGLSLESLADRGGFSVIEAYCALKELDVNVVSKDTQSPSLDQMVTEILKMGGINRITR